MAFAAFKLFRQARVLSIYVLLILLVVYLLNQLDRYTLPIVAKPVAQDLKYGDQKCMGNSSNYYYKKFEDNTSDTIDDACGDLFKNTTLNGTEQEKYCGVHSVQVNFTRNGTNETAETEACEWNYDGSGLLYQVIAGPIFTVVYTIAGIPLGFAADRYNRVRILTVCLILWSGSTLAAGFTTSYWNLALARMGLGIGEAGCNPMATSIISDYFPENLRGSALGVYNFGIYTGYSLAFAIGNGVYIARGWRWVFYVSAIPGFFFAAVLFFTVKEPERGQSEDETARANTSLKKKFKLPLRERATELLKTFVLTPSVFLLCIAGGVRNAGGYVWALNTELFFEDVKGQSKTQINHWMSWIPLVGGSIGAFVGGIISDVFVKKRGIHTRIWVLVLSQILAAPFAAGALFLSPPWCFLSLIPSNIIGEMWVGVTLAVFIDLVPVYLRTSAIAVYFFIITNIGGNMNPLVSVLKSAFGGGNDAYKFALLIMYPGMYALGSVLFLLTLFVLKRDMAKAKKRGDEREKLFGYNNSDSDEEAAEPTGSSSGEKSDKVQSDL
eukprot:m.214851 g.214851  ORF g.214851 m.214851 type:complete len:553 (+) comp39821_c0_seq1:96-1754(+)